MDLQTFLDIDWGLMAPEMTVFITAVVLLVIDLFLKKGTSRRPFVWVALLGVVISLLLSIAQMGTSVVSILSGTYRVDAFSLAFKMLMLIAAGFVLLMSRDYDKKNAIAHRGEYYYLLLCALTGAMMLTSSADLITLFVSLELLSLSSYIMAGLRKNDIASNEAAFKYLVNGGIATAIILFGMSYLYGFTGTTNLYEMADVLNVNGHNPVIFSDRFLIVFAFIFLFVGTSFKLATVPFHMWAPDVYEGAPTPVTAFLSVVSKTAGFVLLLRVLIIAFSNAPGLSVSPVSGPETIFAAIQPYVAVLAGIAMIYGNTAALKQKNIKRMFAYSSIAQAGYVLVPFVSLTQLTLGNVWFYLMAYLFMNLGAFAVIQSVAEKEGNAELKTYSGLYRRSPFAAVAMAVFLISLAGIPFTAGFIGKFNIFVEALLTTHYWLASVMIGATVISYFYYFGVMAKMFLRPSVSETKWALPLGTGIVVVLGLIGTIGFGIVPDAVLGFLHDHFQLTDFFKKG
ncbi:MAG TPA: NADH-quinone oxidoreductase subunit NuoN [Bacillales bacterium]|nr:NADH-quinone oxidoreductase subunit NuoN [Bacillales bacterium]